jgi:hypothetical protein
LTLVKAPSGLDPGQRSSDAIDIPSRPANFTPGEAS